MVTTDVGMGEPLHAARQCTVVSVAVAVGTVVSVAVAVAVGSGRNAKACTATCWLGLQAIILARWQRLQLRAAANISGPITWPSCCSISFTVLEGGRGGSGQSYLCIWQHR